MGGHQNSRLLRGTTLLVLSIAVLGAMGAVPGQATATGSSLEIDRVHDCDGGLRRGKAADHLPAFDATTPAAETCAGGEVAGSGSDTPRPDVSSSFFGGSGGGGGGGGGHGAPAPAGGIASALIGAAVVLMAARVRRSRGR